MPGGVSVKGRQVEGRTLLFKGSDFAKTDINQAPW
jgi:uncharacterized protein with PIN domain